MQLPIQSLWGTWKEHFSLVVLPAVILNPLTPQLGKIERQISLDESSTLKYK